MVQSAVLSEGESNKPGIDEAQAFCDICGMSFVGRRDATIRSFQILACPRCNLLWTEPLRFADQSDERQEDYWAQEVYLANAASQKTRFREQLTTFQRATGLSDSSALRVFECGAGIGLFLDVCEERGIAAEGCDLSPQACAYANRTRQRVHAGPMQGYASESFDAVFAFNLIEHLSHPREFLQEATRMLKPGGWLALETPVQESLFHRAAWLVRHLSRGRKVFYGLSPGGHIYKFSKRTIQVAAHEMGYRVLHQENLGSPFRELWGKTRVTHLDHKSLMRVVMPPVFLAAQLIGQGNRIFVIMQKLDAAPKATM